MGKRHKSKSTWTVGGTVDGTETIGDASEFGKDVTETLVIGGIGNVSDVEFEFFGGIAGSAAVVGGGLRWWVGVRRWWGVRRDWIHSRRGVDVGIFVCHGDCCVIYGKVAF